MKRKLLFAAALLASALGFNANAQEDVTNEYLTNADLSTIDSGWDYYSNAFKYTDWKTDGEVAVVEFYSQWDDPIKDITQKDFKFSQTVTLPAGDYRIAVNAFYRNERGDGTNADKAWIFAGEKKQNIVALDIYEPTGGSNGLYSAALAFSKGEYSNAFDFTVEEEQEIEIGFQGYFNRSLSWCILGPVKLYKYSLEAYINDYNAKAAEAKALYDSPMNAGVLAALKEAAEVDVESMETSAPITEAIQTLTAAIAEANKSIAFYETVKASLDAYADKAAVLDLDGQAAYDVADIEAAYEAGEIEEDPTAAIAEAFAAAVKAQTTPGADFTGAIVNPEINGIDGWTAEKPLGGNGPIWDNAPVLEYWAGSASNRAEASFDYYQEITNLPNGKYTVSVEMFNSLNNENGDYTEFRPTCGLYAASGETTVSKLVDVDSEVYTEYTTDAIEVVDGTLRIGVKNFETPIAARWFRADNFKLTLVQAATPELANPAFDANPADVVEVTTQGYQGNVTGDQVAGLQTVQAWTRNHEAPKAGTSGDGYTGGVFAYGSENLLNNKVAAPATDPEGNSDGVALGVVGLWSGTAQYTQEVTLPAGDYVLTYDVYNGVNTGVITKSLFGFIANDGTEYLSSQTGFTAVGEWQKIYVPFTLDKKTAGKISVGFTSGNFGSGAAPHLFVDNVSYAAVSEAELAVAQAKAAKIAELNTKTITGEIANYSVDKKLAAVAAAETAEEVEAVEAPTYIFTLTASEGLQLNTENGIKIEANGTPLSLIVQTNGKYALSPNEGEYINYNGNSAWALTTTSTAYGWTIALADGKYTITGKGDDNKNKLGTNDKEVTAGSTCWGDKNDGNFYWTIAEYVPTYAVTVTTAGWATWVTPAAVSFEGVEAYKAVEVATEGDEAAVMLEAISEAAEGTPVIIKGTAGEETTYTVTGVESAEEVQGNLLKVAGEDGVTNADNAYVLANLNNVVGFYALDDEYTLAEGKVYLEYNASAGVKFIGFDFSGNATGVKTVEVATEATENAVIYNLAGQRVVNPAKGIYIVNGKKVLVK